MFFIILCVVFVVERGLFCYGLYSWLVFALMMTAFCNIFVEGTDLLDVGEGNVSCETYRVNCGKRF